MTKRGKRLGANERVENEFITDPGDFDGEYGEGSYYKHTMNKDD